MRCAAAIAKNSRQVVPLGKIWVRRRRCDIPWRYVDMVVGAHADNNNCCGAMEAVSGVCRIQRCKVVWAVVSVVYMQFVSDAANAGILACVHCVVWDIRLLYGGSHC